MGGGVFADHSSLTINNATISDNAANLDGGGGIYCGTSCSATIKDSTINGNTANSGDGGGLLLFEGSATIANCTISGNTLNNGDGGGLRASHSPLVITNSTISGNVATSDPEIVLGWSDNSIDEEGFRIERKEGKCSSAAPCMEIGGVAADVTGYPDGNVAVAPLKPDTAYAYRVRAYNSSGSSGYSDCDWAATKKK